MSEHQRTIGRGRVLYEDGTTIVIAKQTREELHDAQEKRSARYGIGIKDDTNLTPPADYPTSDAQYGDPVNYRYPIDADRLVPARQYFNHERQREDGGYTPEEWAIIGRRIARASGATFEYADGKIKRKEEKSEDLDENIRQIREAFYQQFRRPPMPQMEQDFWVERVFDDSLIVQSSDGLYRYPYEMGDDGPVFGEPEKVEIDYKSVAKEVRFLKADASKHLVYGVVMEPDEVDSQGDATTADEIEKACHQFMLDKQALDFQHERDVDKEEAALVENYISLQDMVFGEETVTKGTWIMVTKVFSDDLWGDIESGEITGYSIRGRGVRTPGKRGGAHD